MIKKKIVINPFDSQSIDKAIEELEKEKKEIEKRVQKLIDAMCQEGEYTAKLLLTHIDTGETYSSIMGYRDGEKGIISVGGNAIWIEFGTGVIYNGPGINHPDGFESGLIVGHGEYGKGQGANPKGWFYLKGGKRYHTKGIPTEPFMYETALWLQDNFKRMANEVFV